MNHKCGHISGCWIKRFLTDEVELEQSCQEHQLVWSVKIRRVRLTRYVFHHGPRDGMTYSAVKVSWYPKIDHVFEKYTSVIFRKILFKPLFYKKFQKKKIVSTQSYGRKKICGINFL